MKTRELADEALRSQTRAYEAGLATGLDVVDAELSLSRLQVADLKAHYDAVVAWLGLLEAAGEIESAGSLMGKAKPVEAPAATENTIETAVPADSAAATPADSTANGNTATPAEQQVATEAPAQEPANQTDAAKTADSAQKETSAEKTEAK